MTRRAGGNIDGRRAPRRVSDDKGDARQRNAQNAAAAAS